MDDLILTILFALMVVILLTLTVAIVVMLVRGKPKACPTCGESRERGLVTIAGDGTFRCGDGWHDG